MAVRQTGRKQYRTMQGKNIDMDLLRQRNELTRHHRVFQMDCQYRIVQSEAAAGTQTCTSVAPNVRDLKYAEALLQSPAKQWTLSSHMPLMMC